MGLLIPITLKSLKTGLEGLSGLFPSFYDPVWVEPFNRWSLWCWLGCLCQSCPASHQDLRLHHQDLLDL